jgi:hypothetical protein
MSAFLKMVLNIAGLAWCSYLAAALSGGDVKRLLLLWSMPAVAALCIMVNHWGERAQLAALKAKYEGGE